MKSSKKFAAAALLAVSSLSAHSHGYALGPLSIAHPYSLPTPPGATTGAAYIADMSNQGSKEDKLVGASSPIADHIEIHVMRMDGDVMRMRNVPSIAIAPGQHVAMSPGNGYHLMLVGIKQPFKVGDRIPMTLQFENAGRVDVTVSVQDRKAGSEKHAP